MRKLLLLGLMTFFLPVEVSGYLGRCYELEENLRLLVVDYAMAYPEEHAGLIRVLSEAGFDVDYRPYYPALVESDTENYDVILLMGGGDPGMSVQEVDLVTNFVWSGKVLILAVPSDGPYGDRRRVNPGTHDRYQFNEVLTRLNINLHALNADRKSDPVFNPVASFDLYYEIHWFSDSITESDLDGTLTGRAGARFLVGGGETMPVLLAPEQPETAETVPPEEEADYRTVRQTLRVRPGDIIVGEDIELVLHGYQRLRVNLYDRNREQPTPVYWITERFKGKVEELPDWRSTLTVRVPGNRWGSEYALVAAPHRDIAAVFASREFPVELPSARDLDSIRNDVETYGRTAVAAIGSSWIRTAFGPNSDIGFVVAVDRYLLSGLDRPIPPLGTGPAVPGLESHELFLAGLAGTARELRRCPIFWEGDERLYFTRSPMPGNQKPDFPLNNDSILSELPWRLRVISNALPSQDPAGTKLDETPEPDSDTAISGTDTGADANSDHSTDAKGVVPLRGVWDFVTRRNEHQSDLAGVLSGLGMDFLWTTSPAASYTGGPLISDDERFESWVPPILNRLNGTSTALYVGVSAPRDGEIAGDFVNALDTRGEAVGLPSRLDMNYLNRYLFEPARAIARFSRGQPVIKAIVHDWEPHSTSPQESYAATDAFDDLHFRNFVHDLVGNAPDYAYEFSSRIELDRGDRFEWLLKSGRLETYYQLHETNAEHLGTLYREAIDEINPGLLHGAFVRSLRPTWFRIGFWRGAGTSERPFLIFSYERPPAWYAQFLQDKGISARVIPVGMLGLVGDADPATLLRTASEQGGYALERGIWLVTDPPEEASLNALPKGMDRDTLLEAIRNADGK